MKARLLLDRPVAASCLLAALCFAAATFLARDRSSNSSREDSYFAVTLRDHGIDAAEMERSVAIPLENALCALRGAFDVRTVSEYGRVRVSVRFPHSERNAYEAVREAVQRVYETLPASAQRPEIGSSEESRSPVWTAALTAYPSVSQIDFARALESKVKPTLERVPGAGFVELGGIGLPEIAVTLDAERAAPMGITALDVARSLAWSDALFPSGAWSDGICDVPIFLDGRFGKATEMSSAKIPSASGAMVPLGSIACIETRTKKEETRSRVDGFPAAVVAVVPEAGADLVRVSAAIRKAIEPLAVEHLFNLEILTDRGAEERESYRSVLFAALQGAAVTALLSALFSSNGGLVCAVSVPVTLLVSAGVLAASGYPPDKVVLASLASALGAAVDASLVTVERIGPCMSIDSAAKELGHLVPAQIAGAATSLVVLIPVSSLDALSPGASTTAAAMGTATVCALFLSLIVLPPLLMKGVERARKRKPVYLWGTRLGKRAFRLFCRTAARNAVLCARAPFVSLFAAAALTLVGILSLFISGVDVSARSSETDVFAHLEFESGAAASSIDERLGAWARRVAESIPGIDVVQTTARGGAGSAVVSFDSRVIGKKELCAALRSLPPAGGFVHIAETDARERSWEIVVSGENGDECRSVSALVAAKLATAPFVLGTTLHFKEGGPRMFVVPDREKAASLGVSFPEAAESIRRNIFGPVAYKKIGTSTETDVRVFGASREPQAIARTEDIPKVLVRANGGASIPVSSFATLEYGTETARLHRIDRSPVAAFSIRTAAVDPRRIAARCATLFKEVELPPLYSIEFDRAALERAQALSATFRRFILALLLCYLTLGALSESFGSPAVLLSIVPPSMAVPAIFLAAARTSIDAQTACAFVLVAGLAVNAAVLTVDEWRAIRSPCVAATSFALYRLLRKRIIPLAAICLTTVSGSLPLLFLSEAANGTVRSLAFVSVFGVLASFFGACTVVPSLAALFPRLFNTFKYSVGAKETSRRPGGSVDSVENKLGRP